MRPYQTLLPDGHVDRSDAGAAERAGALHSLAAGTHVFDPDVLWFLLGPAAILLPFVAAAMTVAFGAGWPAGSVATRLAEPNTSSRRAT